MSNAASSNDPYGLLKLSRSHAQTPKGFKRLANAITRDTIGIPLTRKQQAEQGPQKAGSKEIDKTPTVRQWHVSVHRMTCPGQKDASVVSPEPQYLVVAASSMLAAELNAEFSVKLDRSERSRAYFTQGISSSSKQGVRVSLIFDTKTGRAVSLQGYIVVDTPPRGQIVHVAQYTAR